MTKFVHRFFWIFLIVQTFTTPAMANQPPGPGVSLPETLMLPMMALLTALGGGYRILLAEPRSRSSRIFRGLALAALFVFGFVHEGISMMVTCFFGALVIYRGVRMVYWGTRGQPSPPLSGSMAARLRLITAGVLMSFFAVYLMGSAIVFVNYWPDAYQHYQVTALKKILASEIAYGRMQQKQTGEVRFYRITPESSPFSEDLLRHGNVHMDFSPDKKHFTVYILPYSKFPPWPYRSLTKQGSYRADESGQIRMFSVRRGDELCPADAPVVMKVEEDDIREALQEKTPQ